MKLLLMEFLELNIKEILKNELQEGFLLHLLTLFDYQKIDSEAIKEIYKLFGKLQDGVTN